MKRNEILDKANNLVNGQRAKDYGDAFENHTRIAERTESPVATLRAVLPQALLAHHVAALQLCARCAFVAASPAVAI